jgi:hypothetical protein
VKSNAIVASRRDRDAERDQLLGLGVERVRDSCRLRHTGERLHNIRRTTAQFTQLTLSLLQSAASFHGASFAVTGHPPSGSRGLGLRRLKHSIPQQVDVVKPVEYLFVMRDHDHGSTALGRDLSKQIHHGPGAL